MDISEKIRLFSFYLYDLGPKNIYWNVKKIVQFTYIF